MVFHKESAKLIGCIRLNKIEKKNSLAIIGYEYAEVFWGEGFATEALKAIVSYCH